MTKEHLSHFNIAGFTYYDGPIAFEQLKIGTILKLQLDGENKYDPQAVAIYMEDLKLGDIPRAENEIFFKLLKVGLGEFIEVRIQRISADKHPEEQIQIVSHLIKQ